MILNLQRHVHDAIADAVTRAVECHRRPGVCGGGAAQPRARRPGGHGRLPARANAQKGAPRHRAGAGGRRGASPGHRARRRRAERLPQSLSRSAGVSSRAGPRRGRGGCRPREKTIVEHTAINPNKAAHIGHLRNAALGDTLVRVLRFRGTPVEVQNYIDDTGVQVADVIVGFRELEHKTLDEVAASRRHDALRLLLLGSVLARHRMVRAGTQPGWPSGPRRCTTSSTAATTPPRWARSSSIASCGRTWRRWPG